MRFGRAAVIDRRAARDPEAVGGGYAGGCRHLGRAIHVSRIGLLLALAASVAAGTGSAAAQVRCDDPTLTQRGQIAVSEPESSTADIVAGVEGVRIETGAGNGIAYTHEGQGSVSVGVDRSCIETAGRGGAGIHGRAEHGSLDIGATNVTVTTAGDGAHGIEGQNGTSSDRLAVDVSNARITTQGSRSHAVEAKHSGTGLLDIDLENVVIETHDGSGIFASRGVDGTAGDTDIYTRGGSILTRGMASHGIDVANLSGLNGGMFRIRTEGTRITTTGPGAHGILALHYSSQEGRSIWIDVGGDIAAGGRGARAVQIGTVNASGVAVGVAARDEEGFLRQTVTVNARVSGGADGGAALHLAGGGRVVIGPKGSVGAESGVAIRATGNAMGSGDRPRLWLHFKPGDRPLTELFSGRIVNDGGETTILVNEVLLHDGETGATGLWAPNGARDVTMTQSTVILDRDFDAADFLFRGNPAFAFSTRFGPRSAVYEALPGVLQRLNRGTGLAEERMGAPESPFWMRHARGRGSYEPDRSTVGARYDFERLAAEGGTSLRFDEGFVGSLAARLVSGWADVSAPAGGGEIGVHGYGTAVGLAWRDGSGLYGAGRISATRYEVDLSSATRGVLKEGVDAFVSTLDLEAGRRFALDGETALAPRVSIGFED